MGRDLKRYFSNRYLINSLVNSFTVQTFTKHLLFASTVPEIRDITKNKTDYDCCLRGAHSLEGNCKNKKASK